jgi:hypothetical protein
MLHDEFSIVTSADIYFHHPVPPLNSLPKAGKGVFGVLVVHYPASVSD